MLNKRVQAVVSVLVIVITLFTITAANAAPAASPMAATRCVNGATVWADGKNGSIQIWREWVKFNWCYDGKTVSVSNLSHWFQITYPNTKVAWQNQSVTSGANGSKIIFVQGEVEFRWTFFGVPVTLRKYSSIRFQLTKTGQGVKLS